MWFRERHEQILRQIPLAVCYAAVLVGVYLVELHSYLLFHTVVELFSVCVACAIFMIVWNSRHFIQNNYMLFLGIAYLFVGGFDLLHTLAYPGMGVFPGHGTNLPAQLWIVTRYVESLSLLLAPLFLKRHLNANIVLAVYGVISGLLLLSIFYWPVFPACFREQTGLTRFREVSEFVIIVFLLLSLVSLLQKKSWFDAMVLRWVTWSIALTIASEFMFTMYARSPGRTSMIAHFLKLISFYLMYKALIETGMRQPHTLLYRRLKEHESELQKAHDDLEMRVRERTAELSRTVGNLKEEVEERIRVEQAYLESERKYRALVEQTPAVTYIAALDEKGSTLYVSPQAKSIMGFSPDDYRNDPDLWTRQLHPDDRERVLAELTETRRNNTAFSSEYRFVTRDKSVIWLRDEATIVKDENGHPRYIQGVIYDITEAKQAREEILANQEQLRVLTSQLLSVEDQERRRIATTLHDSIGQILAFLKIELGTLQRLELPEQVTQAIARAREQVEEAVRQTRTLTFEISPPELYTLGLESALEELAQRFTQERQIECRVHSGGAFEPLNNQLKMLLYRAVRELLTNAAKHAHAQAIDVELGPVDGCIQITVKDDGAGFDMSRLHARSSDKGTGYGLLSIREQLTHLGGRMDIRSAPGEGTQVILTIPFEHPRTPDRSREQ